MTTALTDDRWLRAVSEPVEVVRTAEVDARRDGAWRLAVEVVRTLAVPPSFADACSEPVEVVTTAAVEVRCCG